MKANTSRDSRRVCPDCKAALRPGYKLLSEDQTASSVMWLCPKCKGLHSDKVLLYLMDCTEVDTRALISECFYVCDLSSIANLYKKYLAIANEEV